MRRVNLILGGLLLCSNIRADFISPPMPVPANGEISEKGNKGMQVTITWTGSIPKKGGQVTKLGSVGPYTIANDGGSVDFGVPETSTSSNGVTQPVKDYIQRTVAASEVSGSDPGPVSVLMLEAFVPDADGTDFDQYGFLDYINGIVGPFVTIWAPDVYSSNDPNSDAVLYEAVNLAPYMANLPTFDLGATFDIVNGAVASLPGMIFGTSEMTFDPNSPNGFDNPDPYTGAGYVLSEHANTVTTPEPHSLILFITIVAMLGIKIRNLYCVEPKSQPALAPASNLRVLNRAHA